MPVAIVKAILVLLVLGLTGPAIAVAGPADRTSLTASLQKIADDYLAKNATTEGITAVSASISLADANEPIIDVVAGRVGKATDAARVTPTTLFPIGSVTKSMDHVRPSPAIGPNP
jgi:CubicO group peptidase (beta-lactamase class C family)